MNSFWLSKCRVFVIVHVVFEPFFPTMVYISYYKICEIIENEPVVGSYWSRNSCDVVTFSPRKTQNEKKNENSHLKVLLMICLKLLSRSFRLNKLLFRNQKQYSDSLFYLHSHKSHLVTTWRWKTAESLWCYKKFSQI